MTSEKSFRTSAVGGFNRQDVMDYIAAMAKEHRSEIKACRAGDENLRKERDELSETVQELISEKEATSAWLPKAAELYAELEDLTRKHELTEKRLSELEADNVLLKARVAAFESESHALGEAVSRSESLESQAYRRAEEIESEAIAGTDSMRQEAIKAISEFRKAIKAIRTDVDAAALAIFSELDKTRSRFSRYGGAFDEIDERLAGICGENKPVVREFVPNEF